MANKFRIVVGPQERYLDWLRNTRGLGGVRILALTQPGTVDVKKLQGYCFPCAERDDILVDLTMGDPAYSETLAYAHSIFR
jgi:hypothetical protein